MKINKVNINMSNQMGNNFKDIAKGINFKISNKDNCKINISY